MNRDFSVLIFSVILISVSVGIGIFLPKLLGGHQQMNTVVAYPNCPVDESNIVGGAFDSGKVWRNVYQCKADPRKIFLL